MLEFGGALVALNTGVRLAVNGQVALASLSPCRSAASTEFPDDFITGAGEAKLDGVEIDGNDDDSAGFISFFAAHDNG